MNSSKRKYEKKSDYWKRFNQISKSVGGDSSPPLSVTPDLLGEPFYVSDASALNISTASYVRSAEKFAAKRTNVSAFKAAHDRFCSIRAGMLPYHYSSDGVDVRDAIELCQKAYANIAIFRNAIDIMAEFANTEIYLEGGSVKSREFFEEWFKKIKLWKIKDQFFREYYRSGNVFLYKIEGQFASEDFLKLLRQVGNGSGSKNSIALKYILLNPYDIIAENGTNFSDGVYAKVLSIYELGRLKNPITQEDAEIAKNLPQEVKKELTKNSFSKEGVKLKLDPSKLVFSFYKKQDYEPFSIPFGYPVLEDINAKLELKKMDQAITRTVENVILLITMGAPPDEGGVNQANVQAMQNLFKNESVGRVLVADYTTKANFIIPDLNKVLGPEKYKTLNEDIKQGLQNIVVGEEKYSSTEIKAQIFIDRLKEARNCFLNDFLQEEIKQIAKNLGMKSYPTAKFRDLDMRDQTQLMRVTTRLMELGVITPQQGMQMFETGQFPKADDIAPAQEKFIDEREDGYYNPIVGGVPTISPPKDPNSTPVLNQTKKVAGRPEGTTNIPKENSNASYSLSNISEIFKKVDLLRKKISQAAKAHFGIDSLSESQKEMTEKLCQSIVVSTEQKKWLSLAEECVKDCNKIINLNVMSEVLDIAAEHELDDDFAAAILYHSINNG